LISKLKDVGLFFEAQGSILPPPPLLFSVYVNDLPATTNNCPTENYVDGTKLYMCFPVKDSDLTMGLMNEDIRRIRNWCFQILLLINPEKTQLMVYGSRQMVAKLPKCFHLSLLGKELIPNELTKDLGETFDRNLNFNEHVIKTPAQCMSELGQIN
jgi:hypothetical protein